MKFPFQTILLILLMALTAIGCKKTDTNDDTNSGGISQEVQFYNVKYGGETRNTMDVFLPKGRDAGTPLIILIHGGSWTGGSKEALRFLQDSLLARGYGTASINYRYASSTIHYQDMMSDIDLAITFLQGKTLDWKIRPTSFMLGGVSAGAHMAMLYSYAYDSDNRINSVVSASGPTNMTDTVWMNYLNFIGLTENVEYLIGKEYSGPSSFDADFEDASPIHNIKNVPTLMLHGNVDLVVFYNQSSDLKAELDLAGVPNKLVTFTGAGHDLGISNPTNLSTIMSEIGDWVQTYGH